MELTSIRVEKPDGVNFILGLARSAKTIEDMHDALERLSSDSRFGIAFSEPAGKRLVRCAGTNEAMIELARKHASAIGAGDTFVVFFGGALNPRDVLAAIKALSDVCGIYCATANPSEVVLAANEQGRGIVGVIDGSGPSGIESREETAWREDYLHHIAGFAKFGTFPPASKPR